MRIIGADGVAAVTNRRIAAEAGVSLGTLTYHFATQRDLVRSALASFVADESMRLEDTADRLGAPHLAVGAEKWTLDGVVSDADSDSAAAWFELFLQAARHPELHEAAAGFFDTYDLLAEQVLRASEVSDVESVAPIAVGLLIGLQLRQLATGGPADEVVIVMARLTRILRGAGES